MGEKTYYLLHYLGNKNESGKSSYSTSDVCVKAPTCFDRSRTTEHNEIFWGRKPALTIGRKIGDGPIVDYVLGIEAIEGNEPDLEGRLVFDEASEISYNQYENAYMQIISFNREVEFMNRQRYAIGIRKIVSDSIKDAEEKESIEEQEKTKKGA